MSRVTDGAPPSNANAALVGRRPRRQSRRSDCRSATIKTSPTMVAGGRKLNCGFLCSPPPRSGLYIWSRTNIIPPTTRSVAGPGAARRSYSRITAKTRLRTAKSEKIMMSPPAAASHSDRRCRSHPDCRAILFPFSGSFEAMGAGAGSVVCPITEPPHNI